MINLPGNQPNPRLPRDLDLTHSQENPGGGESNEPAKRPNAESTCLAPLAPRCHSPSDIPPPPPETSVPGPDGPLPSSPSKSARTAGTNPDGSGRSPCESSPDHPEAREQWLPCLLRMNSGRSCLGRLGSSDRNGQIQGAPKKRTVFSMFTSSQWPSSILSPTQALSQSPSFTGFGMILSPSKGCGVCSTSAGPVRTGGADQSEETEAVLMPSEEHSEARKDSDSSCFQD